MDNLDRKLSFVECSRVEIKGNDVQAPGIVLAASARREVAGSWKLLKNGHFGELQCLIGRSQWFS
jgi:hypothetical protein